MKIDNVNVLTKGECFTFHLINGKNHEKYVRNGNNNICAGSYHNQYARQYELNIVRDFKYLINS